MHTTTLISTAALAFSAFAVASPTARNGNDWNKKACDSPFELTSTYHVTATPEQVVNYSSAISTPEQPGAIGYCNYAINSCLDVICYVSLLSPAHSFHQSPPDPPNITFEGVTGPYRSPAKTATHILEGTFGTTGPPRLAFPNPVGNDKLRRSIGCLTGPFTTGVLTNGVDTGAVFKVAQIEAHAASFFTDSHTARYVPGAVRAQLA